MMTTGYLLQENGDLILQEANDYIIVEWNPADSANRHKLRLLYGNDKRRPLAVYDIAGNDPDGNVFLELSGFVPQPAELETLYREAFDLDGQSRWHSRLKNIRLKIAYYLRGDSAADLENVRAGIDQFIEATRLFYEQRQGEKVWLEYCWGDGLADAGPLLLGQRDRYYEVCRAWPAYPDDLHSNLDYSHTIEQMIVELECGPLVEGVEQIAGDCAGLPDAESDIDLSYSLTDELSDSYTISLWLNHQAANTVYFEYYLSAGEYVRVWWDNSAGTVKITRVSGGVTTTTASSALALAGPTHMVFSNQKFGGAAVLINGAAAASIASYIPTGPGGQLRIGGSVADTGQVSYSGEVDGLKLWATALSAAQAATLYANEWPIKLRGGWINRPLFHKTIDGAGTYHAVNGVVSAAVKDNWGVIGGVPGNAPARVRWAIDPPTSNTSRVYWLGNKISDIPIALTDVLFLDFNATSDSGNSSGDGYTSSGAGTGDVQFLQGFNVPYTRPMRGRFQVLARMKVTTNAVTVKPAYQFGLSTTVTMDAVAVATDANFLLRDLGDIFVEWPQPGPPQTMYFGVVVSRASTATVDVDWIMFLPWPSWRVEAEQASLTVASGDTLIVEGRQAYVLDASDNDSQLQRMAFEGSEVALWPKKYNYIFVLQGEEGTQYVVSRSATVKTYVTPRWLAGGGPVG